MSGAERIDWTGERCVPWAPDHQMLYEHLHRYALAAALVAGRRVLDLACGEGYGPALLARAGAAYVLGVDHDQPTIAHARRTYPEPDFRCASITDPGWVTPGEFDVVTCFEALEHVEEQAELRELIVRALSPDGLVLVSTPDTDVYTGMLHRDNPFHVSELDNDGFRSWLAAGWSNFRIGRQATVVGSLIQPEDAAVGGFRELGVRRVTEAEWQLCAPEPAPYLIAIASNGALPDLGTSLLSDVGLAAIREPTGQLSETVHQLQEVQERFLAASAEWQEKTAALRRRLAEAAEAAKASEAAEAAARRQAAELQGRCARLEAARAEFDASRAGRLINHYRAARVRMREVRRG